MLVIAFVLLVFCYLPHLSGLRDFVIVDCQYTYQPVCDFLKQCLNKSCLPFWNPHNYCGFSELAVSSPSIFYPFNYLLVLLPFSKGEALYLILHQFLAGLASYLFVERLSNSKSVALFAALSLMFCGYMFGMHKYPDFVASVCALLFVLYSSLLFFRESGRKQALALLLLSLSGFMLYTSGRPEIFGPGLALSFVLVICEMKRLHKNALGTKQLAISLSFWLLALLSATLLAAPMILPAAEWTKLSPRSGGLIAAQIFQWSATWYDWFSIVFMQPFGDLDRVRFPEGTIHVVLQTANTAELPFVPSAFMGPVFFTLLILGFLDRSFKSRLLFLLLCLLGVLMSAGDQTPVAPSLLKAFPQLGLLRYPVKTIIIPLLPAIFVSARGLAWILNKNEGGKPIIYVIACFWFLVLILAPALYFSGAFNLFILKLCSACHTTIRESELLLAQADLCRSFAVTGALGFSFAILIWLYRAEKIRKQLCFIGILSVAILPMVLYGADMQEKAAEGGYYEKTAELDLLLQRLAKSESPGKMRIMHMVEEPLYVPPDYRPWEPYFLRIEHFGRDILLADTHFSTNWEYANGYALSETKQVLILFQDAFSKSSIVKDSKLPPEKRSDFPLARICALSNSRYLISGLKRSETEELPVLDSRLFELVHENKRLNIRIYSVKNFARRLYFASNVQGVNSWVELAKKVSSTKDETCMGDEITYVQSSNLDLLRQTAGNTFPAVQRTEISIIRDEPSLIELHLSKKTPGLLVLRDQFYPGWQATLDELEVPILRANLFNRAVLVPSGEHRLQFRFFPASLKIGLALAFGGLILALILALCLLKFRVSK